MSQKGKTSMDKETFVKFISTLKEAEKISERVDEEHKRMREENEQMKIELDEIKSALATLGKVMRLEVKKTNVIKGDTNDR